MSVASRRPSSDDYHVYRVCRRLRGETRSACAVGWRMTHRCRPRYGAACSPSSLASRRRASFGVGLQSPKTNRGHYLIARALHVVLAFSSIAPNCIPMLFRGFGMASLLCSHWQHPLVNCNLRVPKEIRPIVQNMTSNINLQLGWPSPSLFPAAQLLQGASEVLTSEKKTASSLIYGPDAGYEPLRQSIAKWLSGIYGRGSHLTADRVCITNGASGNLDNVLARFTEPGYTRTIWMVEPSYFLACPIFVDNGFQGMMRGVPEDDEGLDIEFLRNGLKQADKSTTVDRPTRKTGQRYEKLYRHIIYCVPTFSNPSAKTMSLRRREELIRLAREFDALVVTDDVYDVLRWPADPTGAFEQLGDAPPRIIDLDRTLDGGPQDKWGNSMSNGSFSKIIAPGVRVGWAEATPSFALALSQVGATRSGGCPAHMTASFVHELLESGSLEKHLQTRVIPTFRDRYYALLSAIDEHLVPLGMQISTGKLYDETTMLEANGQNGHRVHCTQAGGYFIWLLLPVELAGKGSKLATTGLEKYNLKFAFGDMMQVEGDASSVDRAAASYGNGIRLSWAWHTKEEIVEGIRRLATLVQEAKVESSL
jgi:DNA-binding transcriptional MocR family regulator